MAADAATLKLRYPAFADVADATLEYWITDAERIVTDAWFEADREPATLTLAAHNAALAGVLPKEGAAALPTGVTSFRSGTFSATISDTAVSAQIAGGYASTKYGQEFEAMLRRNRGGPRLIGGAEYSPAYGFNGYAGPMPPWTWP